MIQTIKLIKVELRRLLMSRKTYILMAINILIIGMGYIEYTREICSYLFLDSGASTVDNVIIPYAFGTLAGSLIWGISLLIDSDRIKKNRVKDIMSAFTDEKKLSLARILSYSVIVGLTLAISLIIYMPLCSKRMDYLFDYESYFVYPVIFYIPGMLITFFLCEAVYKLSENLSVSIIIFFVLTAAQLMPLFSNEFFAWNIPVYSAVSDSFGSPAVIRLQGYTRILIIVAVILLWETGCLFIRKYGKNAFRSFLIRIKQPVALIKPVFFLAIMLVMIIKQPFVVNSPIVSLDDYNFYVDNKDGEAYYARDKRTLSFNTFLGTMKGEDEILLSKVEDEDLTFFLGCGLELKSATLDEEPLDFTSFYDDKDLSDVYFGIKKYIVKNPEKKTGTLKLTYAGYPAASRSEFSSGMSIPYSRIGKKSIEINWDHMGPRYPFLVGPDVILYVNVPADHTPLIEADEMKREKENDDGTVCWKADYVTGNLVSGSYNSDKVSYSKEDVYFKYSSKYADTVKSNDLDAAICDVFEYCDKHIGEIDKYSDGIEVPDIKIIQTSAENGSGYAGNGVVAMSEDFMSPSTLKDSKAGTNMNETFMHEIIHLYWGDLGLKFEDDGLWSAEGLTVFTTYRIVKEKYGELYAEKYYVDKWKQDVKHLNNNFYYRHPEYLDKLPDSYRAGIETSVSSLKKYSLMPLMLLKAEEKLGGEKEMDKVLQELYSKHIEYQELGTGCTMQDFLDIAGLTEEDLEIE